MTSAGSTSPAIRRSIPGGRSSFRRGGYDGGQSKAERETAQFWNQVERQSRMRDPAPIEPGRTARHLFKGQGSSGINFDSCVSRASDGRESDRRTSDVRDEPTTARGREGNVAVAGG